MSHTPRKTTEVQEKRNPEPRAIKEQPLKREKAEVGMRSLWSIRANTVRAAALIQPRAPFAVLQTMASPCELWCALKVKPLTQQL